MSGDRLLPLPENGPRWSGIEHANDIAHSALEGYSETEDHRQSRHLQAAFQLADSGEV